MHNLGFKLSGGGGEQKLHVKNFMEQHPILYLLVTEFSSVDEVRLVKRKEQTLYWVSLVPRLSPCANEKSKGRGEPGRIYHVRNVMGRENLITCG